MSYVANEKLYLTLIYQFLNSEVEVEAFRHKYFSMWKADRDEEDAKRDAWAERYDLQLIDAHSRGEVTTEEFDRKWVELFGYAEYKNLLEMLNRVFTACDIFDPELEREFEINEVQLRKEIAMNLADYEAAKAN